jgi:hypothetical protein
LESEIFSTPRLFLDFGLILQEPSLKISRVYVYCFDVSSEFAASFKFLKNDGENEFPIKYMEAAFKRGSQRGEFFIEFEGCITTNRLVESFQSQGARQVCISTFANNDGGESAANAVVRVLSQQIKTGAKYTRGTCPEALHKKVCAKLEEADREKETFSSEFNEKLNAGIKASLAEHGTKLDVIDSGMQAQVVMLGAIEGGVHKHAVKLESQAEDIGNIRQSVCNVILDLQTEIKDLKDALAKSNAARDTTEGKLGHKTRTINQQDAYITKLEEEHKVLAQEKQAWIHEKRELLSSKTALQEQLDQIRNLQRILENAGRVAEILSSTLAEERAAKRPRA